MAGNTRNLEDARGVVAGVIGLTLVGSTAIVPVSAAIALLLVAAAWEAGFIRKSLEAPFLVYFSSTATGRKWPVR